MGAVPVQRWGTQIKIILLYTWGRFLYKDWGTQIKII